MSRSRAFRRRRIVGHHEDFVEEARDGRLEAGGFRIRRAEARARRDGLLRSPAAASSISSSSARSAGFLQDLATSRRRSPRTRPASSFAMLRTRLNAVASLTELLRASRTPAAPAGSRARSLGRNRQPDAATRRAPRGRCVDPRRALRSTYCSRSRRNVVERRSNSARSPARRRPYACQRRVDERAERRPRAHAGQRFSVEQNAQDAVRLRAAARTDRAIRSAARPPGTVRRACRACRRATREAHVDARPRRAPPRVGAAFASTAIGR